MARFQGFSREEGLFVLDTYTGEVRMVGTEQTRILSTAWIEQLSLDAPKGTIPPAVVASIDQSTPVSQATSSNSIQNLDSFDMEVLSSYPYPIAKTYQSFVNEKDPRLRCKLLVDTFTWNG